MSKLVKGRNVLAEIEIDSVYYPVFCAKSASFVSNTGEIETTHINSGRYREFVPGLIDSVVEVAGLTTTDNTNGRISILYLIQNPATLWDMRWKMTNDDGNIVVITFRAFTTTRSMDRNIGSYSGCNVSFRVSGGLTVDTTVSDPAPPECEVENPLYLTLAEDATSVEDALLEQDDVVILHVEREGLGHDETSGTPGNREFKFTGGSGNGIIAFDATNPGLPGGETVYVLYKIDP